MPEPIPPRLGILTTVALAGIPALSLYLDDRKRAINQDAHWVEGHWQLADTSGGYADRSDRLRAYVQFFASASAAPRLLGIQY